MPAKKTPPPAAPVEANADMVALLKEARGYLANSDDPWDKRLDLIMRINRVVDGGEPDLFLGSVREMVRLGTSYTNLSQYMSQFFATQQATSNVADIFSRILMPNMMMPPPSNDLFKQMSEWMNAYAKPMTPRKGVG